MSAGNVPDPGPLPAHFRSREPAPVYFSGTPGESADIRNTILFRDTYMPIVNYTMTPNATSVLNLRYGYYNWRDSNFPASAGFDQFKLSRDERIDLEMNASMS